MRLWSLHPKYLDTKGLVAAWREGLLAQKVLEGKTRGYRNHSQLIRFKNTKRPVAAIGVFLREIAREGDRRGYTFNWSKIRTGPGGRPLRIAVSAQQAKYEFELLKSKLRKRDRNKLKELERERRIQLNRVFSRKKGGIEEWERTIRRIYVRSLGTSSHRTVRNDG